MKEHFMFISKRIYSWDLINSLFNLAMFSCEISLGHSAEQAPVLVHAPKPSSSIVATMFCTLSFCSGSPCGNKANWETFAEVNNIAEEFLQAATQAPQPMHAAERKASSAFDFSITVVLASSASPVFTETNPPLLIILSKAVLSTEQNFTEIKIHFVKKLEKNC